MRHGGIRARLLLAFLGVFVPYLALAGIGAVGFRLLWQRVESIQHEVVVQMDGIKDLQLALSQLVMPANDYLLTGDPREREEFERRLARVQEVLARVAPTFHDPEKRRLLEVAKGQVARLEALSREIPALPGPRGSPQGPRKMKLLDRTSGEAVASIAPIHEIAHREIAEEIERGAGRL